MGHVVLVRHSSYKPTEQLAAIIKCSNVDERGYVAALSDEIRTFAERNYIQKYNETWKKDMSYNSR